MLTKSLVFPLSLGLTFLAASALFAETGCSSSSSSGTGGSTSTTSSSSSGGPVSGPMDAHCGSMKMEVDPATCNDMGAGGAGGMGGMGGGHPHEEEALVMYNDEGDDDDCKYHIKWSASGVGQNQDVTFTLDLTTKIDGKPATGAEPDIEAFLDDTHPAPNSDQKPTEGEPGHYTIGPMRFDAPGKWTVRFHYYETCTDVNEASPHGHGAFYLEVP